MGFCFLSPLFFLCHLNDQSPDPFRPAEDSLGDNNPVAANLGTDNPDDFGACRICPFTGKKANRANKISFSAHKTKKLQFVNLQYKRIWWEAGKRYVKPRLSTKALKTIEKNGLDAVAKKAGIDLRKE
ncbi:large ribosomal subunit protein bL28c-like [Alnus glutinosa]|uniref:large ribosomal subunit protein bL28c-like n=1 Tax=Alnus glutinosa TaxID=3517 RepID=UPI002D7934C5|nr:large ribosomal subunit protein bL28c-like [Alnus glutinosa]